MLTLKKDGEHYAIVSHVAKTCMTPGIVVVGYEGVKVNTGFRLSFSKGDDGWRMTEGAF